MCGASGRRSSRLRPGSRAAFTLLELLVVIAIIGVIVGLLLPAVQSAREAARRTQCQNHLHQIVIGMHHFEDVHQHFPSAYETTGTIPGVLGVPGWGWGTWVLPFLEQTNLYQAANPQTVRFGGGANPAQPDAVSQARIGSYRCPSNPAPDRNPQRLSHATSNYRAVAGPLSLAAYIVDFDYGGAMYQNSRTRLAEITDGASNTLAIGECILDERCGKRAALWTGMAGTRPLPPDSALAVWVSDVMWSVDEADSRINGSAPQAFSSRHPGGAFFAWCDGSVRFISDAADTSLAKWAAGRDDGNVAPAP